MNTRNRPKSVRISARKKAADTADYASLKKPIKNRKQLARGKEKKAGNKLTGPPRGVGGGLGARLVRC